MLDHKQLPYRQVDFPNGLHALILRLLGFRAGTAPALKIGGRKVQGTLEISRALDDAKPDPPLYPPDPAKRTAVEQAERWGEQDLQPIPRLLAVAAFARDRSTLPEFMADANLAVPLPPRVVVATSKPLVMIQRTRHGASDEAARDALVRLAPALREAERLLEQGMIGGEHPNAADFQIATSLRVLLCFDDLRPLLEDRPAGRYARELIPTYAGHIRSVLPDAWLAPLREPASV